MSVATIKFRKREIYFLNLTPGAPWSALGSKEGNVGRAVAIFCCVLGCCEPLFACLPATCKRRSYVLRLGTACLYNGMSTDLSGFGRITAGLVCFCFVFLRVFLFRSSSPL